jgi:hypothetical protein
MDGADDHGGAMVDQSAGVGEGDGVAHGGKQRQCHLV